MAAGKQAIPAGRVRLGYACLCLSLEVQYTRGTILKYAQPERLRELIGANLRALAEVIAYNRRRGIRVFRVSSDAIPFGSHPVNQVRWWEEFAAELDALASAIREAGIRISVHPGQYTVLSSPRDDVVDRAIADLIYHARLLDALGADRGGKTVVHGGGLYGDKPAAIGRWLANFERLPDLVRQRLVIENDERLFGVEDVVELGRRASIPVVFDTLHHQVYSGRADDYRPWLEAAFATWGPEDGPPKVHFSSQAAGQRPGAHAALIDPDEFAAFLRQAPERPFDCMLEAKEKDRALLLLRQQLAERAIPRPVA